MMDELSTYRRKPGVMPNKGGSCSSECTPPETSDSIRLDASSEERSSTCSLCLEGSLECVDGGEDHAESRRAGTTSAQVGPTPQELYYHRDAKIVLMGDGRVFKYGFDWSRARMPALAAVSPNLETGPVLSQNEELPGIRRRDSQTLNKSRGNSLVVSSNPSLFIQSPRGNGERCAMAILIVHDCTQWLSDGQRPTRLNK